MDRRVEIANQIIGHIYSVSESSRLQLANILVRFELPKGNLFIREGQVCKYMTYVEQGIVRQFYTKGGKELTEHFTSERGIFVCLESFFRQIPGYLQVETLESAILYAIPYDPLMALIWENREIHYLYSGLLEFALIVSQQKADAHRFECAHERYERLLAEHPEIIKRAPLAYIASYLGMTPETLSRVRSGQII